MSNYREEAEYIEHLRDIQAGVKAATSTYVRLLQLRHRCRMLGREIRGGTTVKRRVLKALSHFWDDVTNSLIMKLVAEINDLRKREASALNECERLRELLLSVKEVD